MVLKNIPIIDSRRTVIYGQEESTVVLKSNCAVPYNSSLKIYLR